MYCDHNDCRYTFNWYNVMSLDGTEVHYPNMLNWMNQVLEDARNAGEKVGALDIHRGHYYFKNNKIKLLNAS